MRKLIQQIQRTKRIEQRKQRAFGEADWMRQQLVKMVSLNQGLVSMSVGR